MSLPEWMPPIPVPQSLLHDQFSGFLRSYSEQQMLDYAREAVEAYKASLKPVAIGAICDGLLVQTAAGTKIEQIEAWLERKWLVTPLYRLGDAT